MRLAESQEKFYQALFSDKVDYSLFKGNEILNAERLTIYRHSICGNRVAALSRLFKCCAKMVGDAYWQQWVETFIAEQPSQATDITACGVNFSDFIAAQPEITAQLPYLADLARLEWAWHQCFHQATRIITSTSLSQAIAEQGDELSLYLTPGIQFISSIYPLADLWQLSQTADNEIVILDESADGYYFILHREHDSIRIKQPSQACWQLCQLLREQDYHLLALCERHQSLYHCALDSEALKDLVKHDIIYWRS